MNLLAALHDGEKVTTKEERGAVLVDDDDLVVLDCDALGFSRERDWLCGVQSPMSASWWRR